MQTFKTQLFFQINRLYFGYRGDLNPESVQHVRVDAHIYCVFSSLPAVHFTCVLDYLCTPEVSPISAPPL